MTNESASSSKRTRRAGAPSVRGEEARRGAPAAAPGPPASESGAALDPARPFDPAVMERSRAIASKYRLILERTGEGEGADGERYLARGVEFPSVWAEAGTVGECEAKAREKLAIGVATLLEMGETPPLPAGERRVQVNIRLSMEERTALEEAARRAGFRTVSDYVRFAALAQARR